MAIEVGSTLPDLELMQWSGSSMDRKSVLSLAGSGKTMIIGVVGAFTPVCTKNHLKDYIPMIPSLRDAGLVQNVLSIGVVDPFVFHAWGEQMGATGIVDLWSDPYCEFSKAIGITADLTKMGLGLRSGRYSMLVNKGVVEKLNIEDDPTVVSVSSAEEMRNQLNAA